MENIPLTLSCPYTGNPEPVIRWYKDGQLLYSSNISKILPSSQLNNNELRIFESSTEHAARYTCEAKNKVGTAEQEIQVEVISKYFFLNLKSYIY